MTAVERDAAASVSADTPVPDCSVIVPAYRGRELIGDCLRSLQRALKGRRAEIVVVESSGDGAVERIRMEFPEVRVLALSKRASAGEARNRGVEASRGRMLFFVDQDCTVPEDWIDRLETHLRDAGVGAVGGSVGIRNLANLSGCGVYFLEFLYHFPSSRAAVRDHNFLLGCNLACHAGLFESVRFPARTLAEDVLFSHYVREAGWNTVYDPRIEVRHWNRTGWREFLRYNLMMGRASAQGQRRLQRPMGRIVLRFPPLVFLAPAMILPRIALGLLGNLPYLIRFLALSPICLVGNLAWCLAFCREAMNPTPDDDQRSGDADSADHGNEVAGPGRS